MVVPLLSGAVDVALTPSTRQYCHVVRFPQGWKVQPFIRNNDALGSVTPLEYLYDSAYEFRVPGMLETTFLVRGLVLPYKKYTTNMYKVDLSDPRGIARPATEQEWQDGTKISDSRPSDWKTFANVHLTKDQSLPLHGFQFRKSGDYWEGDYARLSPDRQWIVLLSSSGQVAQRGDFFILSGRDNGKLYFDVYNVGTGTKLLTIVGTYRDIAPDNAINQSLWVTERYFIVPLGEQRERCLVCEFNRSGRQGGSKP